MTIPRRRRPTRPVQPQEPFPQPPAGLGAWESHRGHPSARGKDNLHSLRLEGPL